MSENNTGNVKENSEQSSKEIGENPTIEGEETASEAVKIIPESCQIQWQKEGNKILLILPEGDEFPITEWSDILQDLKFRFNASEKTWITGTNVKIIANDRLLDARQLQAIAETLTEFDLILTEISTNRRQTAVIAATAGYSVLQDTLNHPILPQTDKNESNLLPPLYLKNPVRSGVEIRHQGTVVVFGDLNPGGSVIAAGDILVWGRLRGMAHAGALGNQQARIMALKMDFTQLRIADKIARAPEQNPVAPEAEVAYISENGIRLTKAIDFVKQHSFSPKIGAWIESPNQLLTKNS
jgi:septum site-determining protein MinC